MVRYPKSMVDMGPVRQDSLHTFEVVFALAMFLSTSSQ